MIGVVVFSHGRLAQELKRAAEMVMGEQKGLQAVGIEPEDKEASITGRLKAAIEQADEGEGVLLLTDMFGGTPMNMGCRYLDNAKVEVVTGANLALVVRALSSRQQQMALRDLAADAADYGRRDISGAGELLRPPGRQTDADRA